MHSELPPPDEAQEILVAYEMRVHARRPDLDSRAQRLGQIIELYRRLVVECSGMLAEYDQKGFEVVNIAAPDQDVMRLFSDQMRELRALGRDSKIKIIYGKENRLPQYYVLFAQKEDIQAMGNWNTEAKEQV